ncbi:MAG: L,D-transpeptidase family protein [Pseudomonadota bacterium]
MSVPWQLLPLGSLCFLLSALSPTRVQANTSKVFDSYLDTPFDAVQGFDLPMGVGQFERQGFASDDGVHAYVDCEHVVWHTGPVRLDRNAIPCREVRAVATGRVRRVSADRGVQVEHWMYHNQRKRKLLSSYGELAQSLVHPGDLVRRGQVLGLARVSAKPGARPRARFELCFTDDVLASGESSDCGSAALPEVFDFIRANSVSFVPGHERVLVLVDREGARLRLYLQQRVILDTDVAFGQRPGRKTRRGDLRTPSGMYFVVERSRGPFSGDYADYFGGYWIKINYPNAFDAAAGVERDQISLTQQRHIEQAWRARELTVQNTALGSGIGFHGWAGAWDGSQGRELSWGCIVLHDEDIEVLYRHLEAGAMVVIL